MVSTDQKLADLQALCESVNRTSNAVKLDFDDFRRDFKDFRNDIEEFQEDTQGQFKLMNERLGKLEGLFHDLHSLVTGLVRAQDKTLSVLVDLRNGHSGTSDSLPS